MVLSIDLDTWCHCRWASGSSKSIWPDAKTALLVNNGSYLPGKDFVDAIYWILTLLRKNNIKGTFFVLAEVARMIPDLVRKINLEGHEIALHGMYHNDNTNYNNKEFREMIQESRRILSDIIGAPIVGYRSPNLIISSEQMVILNEEGFLYDSSVCPSNTFFGKYSNMTKAPNVPYHPSAENLANKGNMSIMELPIPVFPLIKLPAACGIMTRALGGWWSKLALNNMLRRDNYGMYYFHPYEVSLSKPKIDNPTPYIALFCRNIGVNYRKMLEKFFFDLSSKTRFFTAKQLIELS